MNISTYPSIQDVIYKSISYVQHQNGEENPPVEVQ